VIVRIATESQYKLADEVVNKLNELDNAAVAAVESGDEPKFHELFDSMIKLVRDEGHALDDDELAQSDVIIPPADLTFAEAKAEFTGDGLIPD
jgi:hypothetical protein